MPTNFFLFINSYAFSVKLSPAIGAKLTQRSAPGQRHQYIVLHEQPEAVVVHYLAGVHIEYSVLLEAICVVSQLIITMTRPIKARRINAYRSDWAQIRFQYS